VASQPATVVFDGPAGQLTITYQFDRTGALAAWSATDAEGTSGSTDMELEVLAQHPHEVVLRVAGVRQTYRVHAVADTYYVDSPAGGAVLAEQPRFPAGGPEVLAGSLLAPMPAAVGRISVTVGQCVAEGDLLLTLEAMKLEHAVHAPHDGTVTRLDVRPGDQVAAGAVLAVVTTAEHVITE
jgi:acyl-CoA carboxylase subunit alpha